MRKRRAARVLLFDPTGDILLIRCAVPRGDEDVVFWLTPGGEIEPGESEIDAAHREIREELGLNLALEGPIRIDANSFLHQGEMLDNTDFYFRASCEREAPQLIGITPGELEMMKEIRWWTPDELNRTTAATIFPLDLASWVRHLQSR